MFCRLVIPNGGKTRLRRAGRLDYAGPKPAGGEPYLKKDYPSKVTPHLLFYRTHTTSSMPTFMETLEQYEQKLDVLGGILVLEMKTVMIGCVIYLF